MGFHRSILCIFGTVIALSTTGACVTDAPTTVITDEGCESTLAGNACVQLHFTSTADVRDDPDGDLTGILHWSLYKAGDVDLFGPHDNPALYFGETTEPLPFAQETHFHDILIADVPARAYQSLAYLDDNSDGDATSGDPVTFPSDAFLVRPDVKNVINVRLDYIR